MAEQRLIDANKIDTKENGNNSQRAMWLKIRWLIEKQPTIDPETMPIVRQLREELENCKQELRQIKYCYDIAKNGEKQLRKQNDEIIASWSECAKKLKQVTAERDAAVEDLRGDCEKCAHYRVTWNGCTPDFECPLSDRCLNRDMWEWRGPRKEE